MWMKISRVRAIEASAHEATRRVLCPLPSRGTRGTSARNARRGRGRALPATACASYSARRIGGGMQHRALDQAVQVLRGLGRVRVVVTRGDDRGAGDAGSCSAVAPITGRSAPSRKMRDQRSIVAMNSFSVHAQQAVAVRGVGGDAVGPERRLDYGLHAAVFATTDELTVVVVGQRGRRETTAGHPAQQQAAYDVGVADRRNQRHAAAGGPAAEVGVLPGRAA